jgi:hypothetical protein
MSFHKRLASRRLLLLLCLLVLRPGAAGATTLTGTFRHPDGSPVNGKLIFLLSQPARLSDQTAQVVPMVKIFSVSNGQLEAGAFIYGNDVLVPSGTYYLVRLVDSNNNLLFEQKWSIQGATLDLGTLTPTTTGVVLPDPLIKNIATAQTVQGPVNFTSGLTVYSLVLGGNLLPGTTDTNDLGSSSAAWRNVYFRRWGSIVSPGVDSGFAYPPSLPPLIALESSTGGSIASGTYYCVVTYGNRNGETTASPVGSITVSSGTTNKIYVRLQDFNWATGAYKWRVYCGTSSSGPFYLQTPHTLTMAIANNGISRDASGRVTVTTTSNHWTTYLSTYTISGATGCATDPNGSRTVSEPPPSATQFVFQQSGAVETCGGAGATVSYTPAIDSNWWYTGNNSAADIVLSTITLSGTQPPLTNTASIDPLQVALNQTLILNGTARPQRDGRVQLHREYFTLTTPLICFTHDLRGIGPDFSGSASSSGGSMILSNWNDPNIGTVMVMGQECHLENLIVKAGGQSNAIFFTMGDHSGNGHTLRGVSASVPSGSTGVAAIRAYRMNVSQNWTFQDVTADGGRFGVYASNSNAAIWRWDGGRINCGSDSASSAFVHAAGPVDVMRGSANVSDGVPSAVSIYISRLATESCRGIVIDFGGGFLGLYEHFQSADALPTPGTEASIRLWSDAWSSGGSGTGFHFGPQSNLGGNSNYKATVKFGPGSNDYRNNSIIHASVGPSTYTGSSVTLDFGGIFSRPLTVLGAEIDFSPGCASRCAVNRPTSHNGIAVLSGYRSSTSIFDFQALPRQLQLYDPSNTARRRTLRVNPGGTFNFQILAENDSSVDLEGDPNGNFTLRGGLTVFSGSGTPSADGNAALNMPNNFALAARNAANTADVRFLRLSNSDQLILCETNCNSIYTAKQIVSALPAGAAPFSIASTTEVANLNAQLWHGKQAVDFSAALNFTSLAANSCGELTITATGAAVNNPVVPSWPASLESGLIGIMFVSAANTVTVRLCNVTSSPIDPASQTFAGRVIL